MAAILLSYALTNVADVRENLGLTNASKDNLITRKINQVTKQIENYCGRRFQATTYTNVLYNATNSDEIVLRQRPIISFTSLQIRDAGLNISNFETIDSQLYFVDANAGVLKLMFTARGQWARYQMTYTAGYQSIPEDLQEAAALLAAYYVTYPTGVQVGLSMIKEGSREQQFARNNNTLKFYDILGQLGINDVIDSYANMPIMADK